METKNSTVAAEQKWNGFKYDLLVLFDLVNGLFSFITLPPLPANSDEYHDPEDPDKNPYHSIYRTLTNYKNKLPLLTPNRVQYPVHIAIVLGYLF